MKKQVLFFGLLVLILDACKNKDTNPDPASFLAGEYVSDTYYGGGSSNPVSYPINGESVTMTITKVANDTVQIDIRSTPNDEYSPGQNLTFPKAYIESRSGEKGTTSYTVFFYPRTNDSIPTGNLTDALQFYLSDNSFADYYYLPKGGSPHIVRTIRFKRR
ncbi:hypothetical protein [Salmonirosea aquatica]|uniref:Uncharacterized protein n=1 Tax=Salmonirosea aquatica TaxID=2654236 RepID=A0A7C9F846_9BACT|nr:hypothetical protein [Cytophagaceae bacterium SJW1-29]